MGEEVLQEREDRYLRDSLKISSGRPPDEEPPDDAAAPLTATQQAVRNFINQSASTPGRVAAALGTSTPVSPQEIADKRHSTNWMSRTFFGGTKWGVIDTPGPNFLVNPLKTIWSGLEWTQENLAAPIAGIVVGGGAMAVDNTLGKLYNVRGKKWADEARQTFGQRRPGFSGFWEAAGNFNEERDGLFFGEKFVSSIVFDPTTYFGLGLLGRAPVVGKTGLSLVRGKGAVTRFVPQVARYKQVPETGRYVRVGRGPQFTRREGVELSLGALDSGFRQVTDMPFRALAKFARQIPKTRVGKARVAGNHAAQVVRLAIQTGADSYRLERASRTHTMEVLAQALDVRIPGGKLVPEIRKLREELFEEAVFTPKQAQKIAKKLESVRTAGGPRWFETAKRKLAPEIEGMSDQQIHRLHGHNVGQLLRAVQATTSRFFPTTEVLPEAGVRLAGDFRTYEDLRHISDDSLVEELRQIRKTRVSGIGMGQNEFAGTYLSTEAGNRYMQSGRTLHEASANISRPRIFRNPIDYAAFREQFLPPGINIDDASPEQILKSGQDATEALKRQGFDSVYLPESRAAEGILVVFDKANVTLHNPRRITKKLIEAETEAVKGLRGMTGAYMRGAQRFPTETFAENIDFGDVLIPQPVDKASAIAQLKKQLDIPAKEIAAKYRRSYTNKGVQGLRTSELAHLTRMFEKATTGRESLERVAEEVVTLFNATPSRKNIDAMKELLTTHATDRITGLRSELLPLSPTQLRDKVRRMAQVRETANFNNADTIVGLYRQGAMGAIVSALDPIQVKWYQHGLRRYMIRPLSASVLMFPGFPVQNVLEDMWRSVQGLSSVGFRTAAEGSRAMSRYGLKGLGIYDEGVGAVNRYQAALEPEGYGLSELIYDKFRLDKVPGKAKSVFNALNPAWFPRIGGSISTAIRRHYHIKRSQMRIIEILEREQPSLVNTIDQAPKNWILGRHLLKLQEDLTLAVMQGPDAVRELALDYSAEGVHPKEIGRIIDNYFGASSDITADSLDQLHRWAETGGAIPDLERIVIGTAEDQRPRPIGFTPEAVPVPPHSAADAAAFKLPKDLAGSFVNYGKRRVIFADDLDRALYIATSGKPSLRRKKFENLLYGVYGADANLKELAAPLRERVRRIARGDELVDLRRGSGDIQVPPFSYAKAPIPTAQTKHAQINAQLEGLAQDILEREWEAFRSGPEGAIQGLRAAMEAVARANPEDAASLKGLMFHVQNMVFEAGQRVESVTRATMREVTNAPRMSAARKEKLFDDNHKAIDEVLQFITEKKDELVESMKSKELDLYSAHPRGVSDTEPVFANALEADLDLLVESWAQDSANRSAHFAQAPKGPKRASFWQDYYDIRKAHWDRVSVRRRNTQRGYMRAQDKLVQIMGANPAKLPTASIKPKDFKDGPLNLPDLSYIVGGQSENIGQAILSGTAFQSKEEFVDYIVMRAKDYGHTGVKPEHVANLYETQLRVLGLTSDTMDAFAVKQKQLKNMFTELKAAAKYPKYRRTNAEEVANYIEDVAQEVESLPQNVRTRLKRLGQGAVDEATEDLKQAFVNYDDLTILDDIMQGVFPFWKYEVARLAYLSRTSIQTPTTWSTIMPEGRYWEATEGGYVDVDAVPWMEVNAFGGTMFATTRRMFRGSFPLEHEEGMLGTYDKAEDHANRVGLYVGPHVSVLMEFLVKSGEDAEKGQVLPPPASVGLAALEASSIPFIADNVKRMRNQMFPDRFRNYAVANVLAERRFNPAWVDWDTLTPKKGAPIITEQDILDAVEMAAMQEFAQESLGMVRFRGPAKENFRAAQNELYSKYLDVPLETVEDMRREGVPPSHIRPIPQQVSRLINAMPNSDYFRAGSLHLLGEERRELELTNLEFWRQEEVRTNDQVSEQRSDDAQWLAGTLNPADRRERKTERGRKRAEAFLTSRGRKLDARGEVVVVDPQSPFINVPTTYEEYVDVMSQFGDEIALQHPFNQIMAGYYQISPRPSLTDPNEQDWSGFHEEQEAYRANVPDEFQEAFLEELDRNGTPGQKIERKLNRTIIGNYWRVEDEVAEELGEDIQRLVLDIQDAAWRSQEEAAVLRQDAGYKLWIRTIRDRREAMRVGDPRLDYALNIFGFFPKGVSFKNSTARSWWEADGGRPNLGRLD